MGQQFDAALRHQREWGWAFASYLFLAGTAGGLFLLFEIFGLPPFFGAVSLGTMLLAGLVVLVELGNPRRIWRAFARPGTSWVSRGMIFVLLFLSTGVLSLAARHPITSWVPSPGLASAGEALGWAAALCAVMITLYPAFVLFNSRAIPFWKTRLLSALFLGQALTAAGGLILLAAPMMEGATGGIAAMTAALIVINLVLCAAHLAAMHRAGGAARESVRLLTRASLSRLFWAGAVVAGMVLPLLLLWSEPGRSIAGILLLAGSLLFRYCVLKAGVYVAPHLTDGAGLTSLNRANAQLEQEYAGISSRAG